MEPTEVHHDDGMLSTELATEGHAKVGDSIHPKRNHRRQPASKAFFRMRTHNTEQPALQLLPHNFPKSARCECCAPQHPPGGMSHWALLQAFCQVGIVILLQSQVCPLSFQHHVTPPRQKLIEATPACRIPLPRRSLQPRRLPPRSLPLPRRRLLQRRLLRKSRPLRRPLSPRLLPRRLLPRRPL